jgi:hypothetical protein
MSPEELEILCIEAVRRRQRTITLTLPADYYHPVGFPHGELLSVNAKGEKNTAFDPLQLLGWLLPLLHDQPRNPS